MLNRWDRIDTEVAEIRRRHELGETNPFDLTRMLRIVEELRTDVEAQDERRLHQERA